MIIKFYLLNNCCFFRFLLDCKDTYPGYTRLKIANPATTDDNLKLKLKPKSGDFYLSSTALKEDINDNLIQKKELIGKSLSKYRLNFVFVIYIFNFIKQDLPVYSIIGVKADQ